MGRCMESRKQLTAAHAREEELRAGFAAEAYIIEVQALDVSPQRLGQKRHEIHTTQVARMRRVAFGEEKPRSASETIWERTRSALADQGASEPDHFEGNLGANIAGDRCQGASPGKGDER